MAAQSITLPHLCSLLPEDLFSKTSVVSHESGRYYFGGESLRILVVEDEAKVARALQEGLEREEYEVVVAGTGEEGFYLVSAEEFDLVILDLMLPGRNGLQVLSTLRKRGLVTPVLVLTARDAIEDRVQGLDKGADDYLVKPFAFPELLARIRALLRRGRTQQVARLQLADLEMDLVVRRGSRGGKEGVLTPPGFEILRYLPSHKGKGALQKKPVPPTTKAKLEAITHD